MNIAFIENDENFAGSILEYLSAIADIQVTYTDSPLNLSDERFDLVIADVMLKDNDCIFDHKNLFIKTITIYISNHPEFVRDAFDQNVIGYVYKSAWKNELPVLLEKARKIIKGKQTIILKTKDGAVSIPAKEILYFKAEGPIVSCKTIRRTSALDLTEKSLSAVESRLPDSFYRISRSEIINMSHIKEFIYEKGYVELTDGDRHSVSIRRKKALFQTYWSLDS